ncbi:MAG: precorrin-2 C(20)-methyltransferase [Tepidanaerobacteraceae bacterium]|jgi:precorrin-2/cobalt-factor-2 C20-methyltransferase|nr:precorrin-2 C(20)-methyltransferase [Tepidanaerobacteraceae bacterium]
MSEVSAGKLYGVGVGPGDPELITLKAVKILESVPVVLIPSGSGESIAMEIAKPYIKGEVMKLEFPMTRDRCALESAWDENAARIKGLLLEGRDAAFITLGDPMIYSTYIYVMERLKGFIIETVPGVTSFSAAASKLRMPIARGNQPFAVVPADNEKMLQIILGCFENVVLMKVSGDYDKAVELLKAEGFEAGLVIRGGHEDEEVTFDLEKYRGKKLDYLSLIIGRKVD